MEEKLEEKLIEEKTVYFDRMMRRIEAIGDAVSIIAMYHPNFFKDHGEAVGWMLKDTSKEIGDEIEAMFFGEGELIVKMADSADTAVLKGALGLRHDTAVFRKGVN